MKSKVLVVDRGAVAEILALKDLPFEHVVVNGGPADEGLPGATMHELESFTSYEPFRGTIDRHHGDTNSILWTSGTTGPSKGSCNRTRCGCSGRSVTTRCTEAACAKATKFYYPMPMYNSGGWSMCVYPALLTGTTACLDKRFSVSEFWNRLRHCGANHTMTLGAMHVYLFNEPPKEDDADNPLRTMVMLRSCRR